MQAAKAQTAAGCATFSKLAPASSSSGFMKNARKQPQNSSAMLPANGMFQLPVLSMTYPNTMGERIAASADPVFISPLADPENRGAMSMGIAHIGPTVNSAKK